MALIKMKPTSPGTRFVVKIDRSHLHKGGPLESLTTKKNRTGARNHSGRQTTRHIGGGHKQRYRLVDFKRVKDGDEIRSGADAPIKPGNALPLRHIPVGSTVHNIELKVGKGGQLVRSAGGSAQFAAREGVYASVRLKSGEMRKIHVDCRATIGEVGN